MQPFGRIRQIEFAGEDGLILYALGESLPEKNAVVQQVASAISAQSYPWLIEVVPSYDSVMQRHTVTQKKENGAGKREGGFKENERMKLLPVIHQEIDSPNRGNHRNQN